MMPKNPPIKNGKEKFLCGDSEENVLKALGLPYIPPELREDLGEAELFGTKKLPQLVELSSRPIPEDPRQAPSRRFEEVGGALRTTTIRG